MILNILNKSSNPSYLDYSFHFDDKIKLFLTQSNNYWNSDYPHSRINKIVKTFDLFDKIIVAPKQVHGDSVITVSSKKKQDLECDAIIYKDSSNIVGTINVADCIPICVYDSYNNSIALVHSGWRGTFRKIILKTIDALESAGSYRKFFKFFLGPSIRSCCYEVEKNFANQFESKVVFKRDGKYFIDLALQVKFDLEKAFIPMDNIVLDNLCTYDNINCHSFRRDCKNSGRMTMIAYKG